MTDHENRNERIEREVQNERASLISLAAKSIPPMGWQECRGRYDGASDRTLAIALDHLEADETAGNVETTGAHLGRFGRFVLRTDEQGFVDVVVYRSPGEASAQLADVAEVEGKLAEADEPQGEIDYRRGDDLPPMTQAFADFATEEPTVMAASRDLVDAAETVEKIAAVVRLDAAIEYEQALDAMRR